MSDSSKSDYVTITIPRSAITAIAMVLAPFVAEAQKQPEPEAYGSRHPYPPPPGRSHRWMREHSKELQPFGAVRTGGKRGRSVLTTMSPENWKRYVEETRRTTPAPSTLPTTLPQVDVDAWIRASGHRLTRSA